MDHSQAAHGNLSLKTGDYIGVSRSDFECSGTVRCVPGTLENSHQCLACVSAPSPIGTLSTSLWAAMPPFCCNTVLSEVPFCSFCFFSFFCHIFLLEATESSLAPWLSDVSPLQQFLFFLLAREKTTVPTMLHHPFSSFIPWGS